jgi:hypothetical protein
VTTDEDSKKPLANSTLVMALGMALTAAQPLKHIEQNFLFEGPFGQLASYMFLLKVDVNFTLCVGNML